MSDLRKMARDAGFNTEFDDYVIDHWKRFEKLAELIKDAALAQPEQDLQLVANLLKEYGLEVLEVIAALKTQPEPMFNGLTEAETNASASVMGLNRPKPEQEPVAWRYDEATYRPGDLRGRQWRFNLFAMCKPYLHPIQEDMVQNVTPLYTAPPQRKPLTDQEIIEAIKHISHNEMSAFAIARAIERVIK